MKDKRVAGGRRHTLDKLKERDKWAEDGKVVRV